MGICMRKRKCSTAAQAGAAPRRRPRVERERETWYLCREVRVQRVAEDPQAEAVGRRLGRGQREDGVG